jgi:hypothetical protein
MWQDLCVEGVLIPGQQSLSFQCPRPPHNNPALASLVSSVNPKCECPCSLLTSLRVTHPDCDTWMVGFCEEKSGIQSPNTYIKIGLAKYRALRAKGTQCTIPSMYVLSIKKDNMLNPLQVKSRIIVLGNHEDPIRTKPEKYAPIL